MDQSIMQQVGRMMADAMSNRQELSLILFEFSLRKPDGPYSIWPRAVWWVRLWNGLRVIYA